MTDHPTPPPAAQTREPGWYWAVPNAGFEERPYEYDAGMWWWDGHPHDESEMQKIGPRIPTPAERPGDAALAERLRALDAKATPGLLREHPTTDGYLVGSASDYAQMHIPKASDRAFIVALVNAYRAGALSPAPRDGGWLPIESAPRDGSSILLAWGGKSREGHWLDNTATRWPWAGWKVLGMLQPNGLPTHWRPLPAAPTEDGR